MEPNLAIVQAGKEAYEWQFIAHLPVGDEDFPIQTAEANARLIAAAPDLLAACQRIARDFAEGGFDGVTIGAIEDAIAAAKKAEGRNA